MGRWGGCTSSRLDHCLKLGFSKNASLAADLLQISGSNWHIPGLKCLSNIVPGFPNKTLCLKKHDDRGPASTQGCIKGVIKAAEGSASSRLDRVLAMSVAKGGCARSRFDQELAVLGDRGGCASSRLDQKLAI